MEWRVIEVVAEKDARRTTEFIDTFYVPSKMFLHMHYI
jgi:hypothetical protein